jgi:hypothetical protein
MDADERLPGTRARQVELLETKPLSVQANCTHVDQIIADWHPLPTGKLR